MTAAVMTKALVLGTMLVEVDLMLKSFFERLRAGEAGFEIRHYWAARMAYLVLLGGLVTMIFGVNRQSIGLVIVATILSSTDRLLCGLQQGIHSLLGLRPRILQALQQALLIGLALWSAKMLDLHPTVAARSLWTALSLLPGVSELGPHKTVAYLAGAIWLMEPTNFVIRWLLNKDDDQFLVEAPQRLAPATPGAAATEQAAAAESSEDDISADTLRAGRIIGALERLTLLILILKEQYGALGLVLTAKSMARFAGIQERVITAEYYLLGTLLSTFAALIMGLLLSNI